MTNKPQADTDAARELVLWATSDRAFYLATVTPTARALAKKVAAGTFDASRAAVAWEHAADQAARAYTKEFASQIEAGDWNHTVFNKATRQLAAVGLGDAYSELVRDIAADLKTDRDNRRIWTLAAVRQANDRAPGGFFFSRDTMRFFGDTGASWRVVCEGGRIYLERVRPMRDRDGTAMGGVGQRHEFNPETGLTRPVRVLGL